MQKSTNRFGYTVSLWIRNQGNHMFTSDVNIGWSKYHFIKIHEVFALWYDSATSFKAYVFSDKDFNQYVSPSVFTPLH